MALKLYNSLTRQREEFRPLKPPTVTLYVCGPTVYGHSHLGHAKSYVFFDTAVRWMRASGYVVNYVQNITDVGHLTDDADEGEDKIVVEARKRGLHPMAVVDSYLRSYLEDMDALNIGRPDIMPRATGHIPEQIELTQRLIERGCAYESNGSVYFSVNSFPEYGKLSGRRTEDQEAGARVSVNVEKRNPADFALWKRADASHIMQWPSPWGAGFPGWHIECSAMSQKYLGITFDIHGGGIENQFPHHECEIAQSEAAYGQPFARYWLHHNMVTLNGQKMGKSLGNAISLKDVFHGRFDQNGRPAQIRDRAGNVLLEKTYEPVVVRHFLLTSHYRQPQDFSNEALRSAESGSYRLRDAARALEQAAGRTGVEHANAIARTPAIRAALDDVHRRFTEAMDEDFNTAMAVAALFDLAKQSGEWIRDGAPSADLAAVGILMKSLAGDVLGLQWPAQDIGGRQREDDLIRLLIDLRNEARKAKNFDLGDQIRGRLSAIGVELRDGPSGTTW